MYWTGYEPSCLCLYKAKPHYHGLFAQLWENIKGLRVAHVSLWNQYNFVFRNSILCLTPFKANKQFSVGGLHYSPMCWKQPHLPPSIWSQPLVEREASHADPSFKVLSRTPDSEISSPDPAFLTAQDWCRVDIQAELGQSRNHAGNLDLGQWRSSWSL